MKTKVEVLGYEIEIEEVDGVVTVKAELDGETVEEFTLETPEEGEGQEDGEDVQSFGDFDSEEDEEDGDFEDSEDFESEDEDEDEDDKDEDKALESFQSFFEKKKN